MSDTRVSILSQRQVTPGLVHAWQDLAMRALEPNPFHEPDFVIPALHHLANGKNIALLVVRRGNQLDALLPVQRFKATRHSPPVPTLSAWSHPYQFLGTPLVDADRAREALSAILNPPLAVRGAALFFSARWMSDDGVFRAALEDVLHQRGRGPYRWTTGTRAVLTRSNTSIVGSERRYKQVRQYRRLLERDVGWVRVVDRSGDPKAVEDFLALEASGWKGREGTALASQISHAQFFRDVCARFASAGTLHLVSLETPRGTLAMECHLRTGRGSFLFKIAYDERFSHYRPGLLLLLDTMESFNSSSLEFIDSCADPTNKVFNRFWPDRRCVSTIIAPLDGHVSKGAVALVSQVRRRFLGAGVPASEVRQENS